MQFISHQDKTAISRQKELFNAGIKSLEQRWLTGFLLGILLLELCISLIYA
jgi:hypothetical protein